MKNTIKTLALASTLLFSAASFADGHGSSQSYTDYLAEVNAQINDFNPTPWSGNQNDPEFEALEARLVQIIAQMKGFWFVAEQAQAARSTVPADLDIKDIKGYLTQLEATANNLNARVFSNFREDPEFKKLESEMIAIMQEMANNSKK